MQKKQALSRAGIKLTGPKMSPLSLTTWKGNVSPSKDPFSPPTFSPLQQSILSGATPSDLNVWRFMSGSTYMDSHPQQTVSTLMDLLSSRNNIAKMDIETLGGVGAEDVFSMPVEITINAYSGVNIDRLGSPSSSFNTLIAPSVKSVKELGKLIKKAQSGQSMSKGERTVLVHLLRYGTGFEMDQSTGAITSYSPYFDNPNSLIDSNRPLNELSKEFGVAIRNLRKYGKPETSVKRSLSRFASDLKGYTISGHNIKRFDIPLLKNWHGGQFNKAINEMRVLDTLDLYRMIESDPLTFHSIIGKTVNPAGASHRAPYSMDAIRETLNMFGGGIAHSSLYDTRDAAQILETIAPQLRSMIESPLSSPRDWRSYYNDKIGTDLRFDPTPIRPGDIFFARRGLGIEKGSHDFSVNTATGQKTIGPTNINRGFFYEFKGFSKVMDEKARKEIHVAEFFSEALGRVSYITAESPEDLASKIHGSHLMPWQLSLGADGESTFISPSTLGLMKDYIPGSKNLEEAITAKELRQRIEGQSLDDLASRRWRNMFSVQNPTGGAYGIYLAEEYLSVAERIETLDDIDRLGITFSSIEKRRDFERLFPRLKSESKYLREAIDTINKSDLKTSGKNYAFRRWYTMFNEEVSSPTKESRLSMPFENAEISLLDPSRDSGFRSASVLDEGSFSQTVYSIIRGQVNQGAYPEVVAKSEEVAFRRILRDLQSRGQIDQEMFDLITGSENLKTQIALLRRVVTTDKSLGVFESKTIELESLAARNIKLSMDKTSALIEESMEWVRQRLESPNQVFDFLPEMTKRSLRVSASEQSMYLLKSSYNLIDSFSRRSGFNTLPVMSSSGKPMAAIFPGKDAEAVKQALISGEMSPLASYVDLPFVSDKGDLHFGRVSRISQIGKVRRTQGDGSASLDVLNPVNDLLSSIGTSMRRSLPSGKDLKELDRLTPQDISTAFRRGVNRGFEGLSGLSLLEDPYSEYNSLISRGTMSDIYRGSLMRVTDLIPRNLSPREMYSFYGNLPSYLEEHKASLAPHFQDYYSKIFGRDMSSDEVSDMMHFWWGGVKDTALHEGKGLISPINPAWFTPFGQYIHPRRPNIIQRLNYTPLQHDVVAQSLESVTGATPNPLLVTQVGRQAYRSLGPGHVTGINLRGAFASPEDLQTIFKDVLGSKESNLDLPSVWEQNVIVSPEAANALTTYQKRSYVIDTRSQRLSDVFDSVLSGERDLSQDPINITNDFILASETSAHGTKLTRFRGREGQITGLEVDGSNIVLDITSISRPTNSTKVDIDGRKYTMRIDEKFRDHFGDGIHFVAFSKPEGHLDIGSDLSGTIKLAIDENIHTPEGRKVLKGALDKHLGIKTRLVRLPGYDGAYTVEMDNEVDLSELFNSKGAQLQQFLDDLGISNVHTIGGKYHLPMVMGEMRRANVDETSNIATWLGDGIERGYGVKIGPREFRSIRIKGRDLGVDTSPITNWLEDEVYGGPGYSNRVEAWKGFRDTLAAVIDPEQMKDIPIKTMSDFERLPEMIDPDKFYTMEELEGTIFDQSGLFAVELPSPIKVITGRTFDGAEVESQMIDRLVLSKQMLELDDLGHVYLSQQQRHLRGIYHDLLDLSHADLSDADMVGRITESIQSGYQGYLDELAYATTASKGAMLNKVMTGSVRSSGYFFAQGMGSPESHEDHVSDMVKISRNRALELYGKEGVEYIEENGLYTHVMRHPDVSSDSIQVARVMISDNLGDNEIRMTAPLTVNMNADFDGDRIALISPWTEYLNPLEGTPEDQIDNFYAVQRSLKKLHEAQKKRNIELYDTMVGLGSRKGTVDITSETIGVMRVLQDMMNDEATKDELLALAQGTFSGSMDESVFRARAGKLTTGSLFNISSKAADLAEVVFEKDDPRLRLIDVMGEISSEPMSIKSKSGHVDVMQNFDIISALNKGRWEDIRQYSGRYSELVESHIVWGQEDVIQGVARSLGYEGRSISELSRIPDISDQVEEMARPIVGERILRAYADMRQRASSMSPSGIDPWHTPGMKTFLSTQASRDLSTASAAMQAPEILTETQRKVGAVLADSSYNDAATRFLGSKGHYEAQRGASSISSGRAKILPPPSTTRLDPINSVADWARGVDWTTMSKRFAAGAGVALGLYLTSRALRDPIKEEDEFVPQASPEARLAPPQAFNISISAKNKRNVSMNSITGFVGSAMRDVGFTQNLDINVHQRDDTRSLSNDWIQDLFTQAVRRS